MGSGHPMPTPDEDAVPALPPVLTDLPVTPAEYAVFTLAPDGWVASWTADAEKQTGHTPGKSWAGI